MVDGLSARRNPHAPGRLRNGKARHTRMQLLIDLMLSKILE